MTTATGIDWWPYDGNQAHPDIKAAVAAEQIGFAYVRACFSTVADNYGTIAQPEKVDEMLRQIEDAGIVAGAYGMPDYRLKAAPARDQAWAYWDAAKLGPGRLPSITDLELGGAGLAGVGCTSDDAARAHVAEFLGEYLGALEEFSPGSAKLIYASRRVCDDKDADTLNGVANRQLWNVDWFVARYPFAAHLDADAEIKLEGGLANPPLPVAARDPDNFYGHQYAGDAWHLAGFRQTDLNRWHYLTARSPDGERKRRALSRLSMALGAAATRDFATDLAAFQTDKRLRADSVCGPATYAQLGWIPLAG
jgi:hypothetical protein